MAVRNPDTWNDAFVPPHLDNSVFEELEKIIVDSESSKEGYKELVPTIYNLRNDDIDKVIAQEHSNGVTLGAGALRGYQTYGVKYILTADNALLTDSVGLGKTSQSASVINILASQKESRGSSFRFLYVTEIGLLEQSRRELIKFTGRFVPTTTGSKGAVDEFINWVSSNEESFHGVVASYSAISSSYDFVLWMSDFVKKHGKFDLLIIDEGSVLSNSETGVYRAFKTVRDKFVNKVVILNATPFESNLLTMYNQLDFLYPKAVPFQTRFEELFIRRHHITREILGYKNPELFKHATRYLTFGQTRSELGISIRSSTCEIVMYKLSNIQRTLLKSTRFAEYVFDDPSWLDASLKVTEEVNPKLKALRLLLEGSIRDDKVVVYCKSKEAQATLLRYLEEHGYRALILNGDDNSASKKAEKVAMFNEQGYQVLITNLKKGLNLGHVNHLVFYSFSGNSGLMAQIEGRIIRSQSILNKHIYLLLSRTDEFRKLEEARSSLLDRMAHTKEETSLLNEFLVYGEVLKHSLEKAKEGISDGSHIYVSGAVFSNETGDIKASLYGYDLEEDDFSDDIVETASTSSGIQLDLSDWGVFDEIM